MNITECRKVLQRGVAIPAHPLALNSRRKLDERRQRALSRYYIDSGAGGLAVGVHTTQFEIHDPNVGLLEPVLTLGAEEVRRAMQSDPGRQLVLVAGICGQTQQAVREAQLARDLGYGAGLVSLAAMRDNSFDRLLDHCKAVAEIMPVFGFYLQPKVGGIELPLTFWRGLCEIENVVAIKVAAFNRYQTLDVVRAVAESGRNDISLYTGNDDNIVLDLATPFPLSGSLSAKDTRFVGGLLGQWAVWTSRAVTMLKDCHALVAKGSGLSEEMLRDAAALTDANSAIFDASNGFKGCVPGIHEVLRRLGLLEGTWCLNRNEVLSKGQLEEIDRVWKAYPQLVDDDFVQANLSKWLDA